MSLHTKSEIVYIYTHWTYSSSMLSCTKKLASMNLAVQPTNRSTSSHLPILLDAFDFSGVRWRPGLGSLCKNLCHVPRNEQSACFALRQEHLYQVVLLLLVVVRFIVLRRLVTPSSTHATDGGRTLRWCKLIFDKPINKPFNSFKTRNLFPKTK
jgi:hypothetical protein